MKEKIIEIARIYGVSSPYGMADELEIIVNQEVERRIAETIAGKFIEVEIEKRIKERMPSEEEITATAYNIMINYLTNGNPDRDFVKSTIGADDNKQWWANGVRWLRSAWRKGNEKKS
jgi:hypothetical protein